MRETLSSIWTWVATSLLILSWFPIMALVWLFDRDPIRYRTGRAFRMLGGALSHLNPFWDIEVTGDVPTPKRQPFVVVCNHLSHADVPIISRLPWEMKWVAKKELFDLPIAGWMMRMARDIPVKRSDRRSRAEVLVHARKALEHDCPVMFFPEGTRSRDGQIHRFANGPFGLAIKQNVPVLPLALDGTQDALPKHSWKFKDPHTKMRLTVMEPIDTTGLTVDDADDLRIQVRRQIIEQVAEWRGEPVATVDALMKAPDQPANEPERKESVKPSADME